MGFAMDYSSVGKDFSILNRLCGNKLIDKQIFSVYRNRSLTEQNNNQTANCSYRYSGLDKLLLAAYKQHLCYFPCMLQVCLIHLRFHYILPSETNSYFVLI